MSQKTTSKKLALVAMSCVVPFMVACGGDDDSSGVDPQVKVNELTPAQANDICEFVVDQVNVDNATKVGCYLLGIIAGADCETAAQACIDAPPTQVSQQVTCSIDQTKLDMLPACASEITAGEWEACEVAITTAVADLADNISCTLDITTVPTVASLSACNTIQSKCPDLADF